MSFTAPDEATASAMLDGLAALGISEQCATPHQKANQYLPAWDRVEATFAALERAAALGLECAFDLHLVAPNLPPFPAASAYLIRHVTTRAPS